MGSRARSLDHSGEGKVARLADVQDDAVDSEPRCLDARLPTQLTLRLVWDQHDLEATAHTLTSRWSCMDRDKTATKRSRDSLVRLLGLAIILVVLSEAQSLGHLIPLGSGSPVG